MSSPQPEIRFFSRRDLRDWLHNNQCIEGLSSDIITPTRAEAIIHNPWLQDDEPVVAAVYIDNQPAAFTASFPDRIGNKTYHWFSTLWCSPEHRGKGFGLLAVGSLCETYGAETCLDMWGAPETVGIFQYLGHNTASFPEYRFEPKHINTDSLKGKAAWIVNRLRHTFQQRKPLEQLPNGTYHIQYHSHIDEDTYRFITHNNAKDLMPRSRETLNWILSHHFVHRAPLISSEPQTNTFDDRDSRYWMSGVSVHANNRLVGFYILRDSDHDLAVKYLYYLPDYQSQVYHSIARHIVALGNPAFSTRHKQLAQYITALGWYERSTTTQISFSYPNGFEIPSSAMSQGGDGDGFV